jgi:hypothetical protein
MPEVQGGGGFITDEASESTIDRGTKNDQPPDRDSLVFWEEYSRKRKNEAGCDRAASKLSELVKLRGGSGNTDDVGLVCTTKDGEYIYDIKTDSTTKYYFPKNKQQEPDDSNPTPYLGGSMGPVLPEKDNDTGKVLPDADLSGFDAGIWKAEPGDVDDSGRFYGGIKGDDGKYYPDSGGARPIDPKRKTEDEADTADSAG